MNQKLLDLAVEIQKLQQGINFINNDIARNNSEIKELTSKKEETQDKINELKKEWDQTIEEKIQ